jgi:catechol 2,3-dioxygenase-like lactoylglutathione lyase family enzyme
MLGTAHIGFTVSNLQASLDFYQGVLGLELIGTMERKGQEISRIVGEEDSHLKIAFLKLARSAGVTLELIEYVAPRGDKINTRPCNPGVGHLCFKVDDLAATFAMLRNKGVRFKSEPIEITTGMNKGAYTVYLSDPDGIPLEIFQPPRPLE